MSWDDVAEIESRLNRALAAFDWKAAEAVCDEIVGRVASEAEPLPVRSARKLLGSLREKGRFGPMKQLGRALLASGQRAAVVRRQYAQSLIEEGQFYEAEQELLSIINDPQSVPRDVAEAKGLLGRHYKQLYVNDPASPRARAHLGRALKEYEEGYQLDPYENHWHGINVAALAARARRDAVPLDSPPAEAARAAEIVSTLDRREEDGLPVGTWEEATRLEAYVALGRHKDALDTALRYLDCADTDAFQVQSTTRQLKQVWQLTESAPPGDRLLPLLHSAHLKLSGGAFELDPRRVAREAAAARAAEEDAEFQALLGATRMQKLRWYRKGLAQCASVARIELVGGGEDGRNQGIGTGWLVRAADFFPGWTGVLVLTNDHVVSVKPRADGRPPHAASIRPEQAEVNFQVTGEVFEVEAVVHSSYYKELDYSFLRLRGDGVPRAEPLALHADAVAMEEPPPRMYVIGYPMGRDLELGLQDNLLIACNERLLHYRTPTEHGNSGSPVFEPADWRVVALHHKGSKTLARLDDPATKYEANEGVTVRAIQHETRRAGLAPPAVPPGGTPVKVNQPF